MKNILLIGDSISLDYGRYLKKLIREDITLQRKSGISEAYHNLDVPIGGNCGDSSMVLNYLDSLNLEEKVSLDWLFFNCGLHDIKRNHPDAQLQIIPSDYEKNLREILCFTNKNSIQTAFITTTPADQNRYSKNAPFYRKNEDVLIYNGIAKKVMQDAGVKVLDLYRFTAELGLKGDELFRDHAHYQPKVIELQAAYLAGAINVLV